MPGCDLADWSVKGVRPSRASVELPVSLAALALCLIGSGLCFLVLVSPGLLHDDLWSPLPGPWAVAFGGVPGLYVTQVNEFSLQILQEKKSLKFNATLTA